MTGPPQRRPPRGALPTCAAALLAAGFPSLQGRPPSSLTASGPQFHLRAISTAPCDIVIESWNPAGLTAAGRPAVVATDDIIDLVAISPGASATRPVERWLVETADGERVSGEIEGGDESSLMIAHATLGRLRLELDRLACISRCDEAVRSPPRVLSPATAVDRRDDAGDEDRIQMANGDRTTGLIERIDSSGITLQSSGAAQTLRWPAIRRIDLARTAAASQPASPALRVFLFDDVALCATEWTWAGPAVALVRPGGGTVRVPARDIARVEVAHGRWTWLADVPVASYQSTPYLSRRWPMLADANVMGDPLRSAGREHRHGIGLHAAATVTWKLDGQYSALRGLIGIDDAGGVWSDVDVEVRLDGQSALTLEHVAHGQPPRPIDLNVIDARLLELRVGFGRHGDVQDRLDLLDIGLVRRAD